MVWGNRSACFLRLDKHEKALQDAQIARALDPSYVKVWVRPLAVVLVPPCVWNACDIMG